MSARRSPLLVPAPPPGADLTIGPEHAGWAWCGLRVLSVPPGVPRTIRTGNSEVFVLPLAGSAQLSVADAAGRLEDSFTLEGRQDVFSAVSDFCYAGRDSVLTVTSSGGVQLAVPSARCSSRRSAAYGAAAEVPVEVRGAGVATRQVTNFGVPGVWDHAERLMCCELITPAGNWSSYPAHKHDSSDSCQVSNEEIYYYRIAGTDQRTPSRQGFGLHRTYTGPEHAAAGLTELDELIEVRDGDAVLVPHGYHGPVVAAPGYPMYYLNVLAGAGDRRSMAFCDDEAHSWLREAWRDQVPDPRCPVTSATGRLDELDGSPR